MKSIILGLQYFSWNLGTECKSKANFEIGTVKLLCETGGTGRLAALQTKVSTFNWGHICTIDSCRRTDCTLCHLSLLEQFILQSAGLHRIRRGNSAKKLFFLFLNSSFSPRPQRHFIIRQWHKFISTLCGRTESISFASMIESTDCSSSTWMLVLLSTTGF